MQFYRKGEWVNNRSGYSSQDVPVVSVWCRSMSPVSYTHLSAKCPVCNGSGRVKVQSKVITRIEPFVPGEDDTELMTM